MQLANRGKIMRNDYDILIIGGGASALAAAITLKTDNPDLSCAILEKKDVIGKKLSQTGNGRCNISNVNCDNLETVLSFMSGCGIFLTEEEGRIYPYSEDAKDVVSALKKRAVSLGVEIILNCEVKNVEAVSPAEKPYFGFHVFVPEEPSLWPDLCQRDGPSGSIFGQSAGKPGMCFIHARKVLIATGGKSYASFGTTGDGYAFARKLGHHVSKLAPALTAVEVTQNIKPLKGVRSKAKATLWIKRGSEDVMIAEESGEVQFREDSVSGIMIMNLSRFIKPINGLSPEDSFKLYTIKLDLIPGLRVTADRLLDGSLETLVKAPIAALIERKTDDIDERIDLLRNFNLTVKGLKGWNEAQVTSGGVSLDEVDMNTMESKLVPDLYFTGEVLDYDGPCGGYNLNFAWYTGIVCGHAMAKM